MLTLFRNIISCLKLFVYNVPMLQLQCYCLIATDDFEFRRGQRVNTIFSRLVLTVYDVRCM